MTYQPSSDPELLQLIEVATKQFLRLGFKSVSMDDIARELGRSKKTLYQLVSNKQGLVELVLDAKMSRDDLAVEETTRTAEDAIDEMLRIARYFTQSLKTVSPAALNDLQKYYRPSWERLDQHRNENMIGLIRDNLRRGQAEGLYRHDLNIELIAHLCVGTPRTILDTDRGLYSSENSAGILNDWMLYHLLGICSPQGRQRLTDYLNRTPNA